MCGGRGREGGGRDRRERGEGERGEGEMLERKWGGREGVLYNAHINIYTSIIPLGSTIAETLLDLRCLHVNAVLCLAVLYLPLRSDHSNRHVSYTAVIQQDGRWLAWLSSKTRT